MNVTGGNTEVQGGIMTSHANKRLVALMKMPDVFQSRMSEL